MTVREESRPLGDSRATNVAVWLVAVWFLALIPLRVVALGHRPADDARRHAAKVVSGKPWSEILVLREGVTVDPHQGWHAVLAVAQRLVVETPTGLLVLSVVSLGVLALVAPLLFWRGRSEAWLLALLVAALTEWGFLYRLMLGRPLVISIALLLVLGFVWQGLDEAVPARRRWAAVALMFALSVWMHGNWYLWGLPLACFFAARRGRAARRLTAAVAAGTAAAALASGQPLAFLVQTFVHPFRALASDLPRQGMVSEFQAGDGALPVVAAVLGLLVWRRSRGRELAPLLRDPIFLLAGAGWALGFYVVRFWLDWGMPACVVWMARELDEALESSPIRGRTRLLVTAVTAAALVLAVTVDTGRRWSHGESAAFLSLERPEHRPWLPEPGGILYTNDMRVFYNTFFKNPRASWRYAVGFEPSLMPPEDLAVFRAIQRELASDASFAPWVAKMRPEDRLIIVREGASPPVIPSLEWHSPYREMWIGRRPSSGDGADS
ncbi:MAG TPA: hypothetical protein VGC00_05710 [Thermoanaerobaculia bacterium]|jgi:hypothetical protein